MQSPTSKCATPWSKAGWKRSFVTILPTLLALTMTLGCAPLTKPSPVGVSPLAIALCPELTPLNDTSFGATTNKLVEVAGIYHECRTAALAEAKRK